MNLKTKYQKYNSFVDIRQDAIEENIYLKIKPWIENFIKSSEKKVNNDYEKEIITKVYEDLFLESKNKIKFKLTPNIIKEISALKEENYVKYLYHRYRYDINSQASIKDDYPPCLQIEPASICNYRCVFCYQTDEQLTNKKNGHMGIMSLDMFKKIIDEAENNIQFVTLASRGEPLVCKEIDKMLDYTKDKFLNLKINTNASLLNDKISHAILRNNVQTLVFSADAAEPKLYSQLRVNGSLEKILKNIKNFQKIKKEFYPESKIITRVSGVKVNSKQNLDEMESLWKDLVDQVAFVNYLPWENAYISKPTQISNPCSDLWRRMFVWWDGKVNPCDVDYKSNLSIGTINSNLNLNIKQLWSSINYEQLRQKHKMNKRNELNPCINCSVI